LVDLGGALVPSGHGGDQQRRAKLLAQEAYAGID